MKKLLSLFALTIMLGFSAKSQNCNFTYGEVPGSTVVSFTGPSGMNNSAYLFMWYFNSSNSYQYGYNTTHTYNQTIADTVSLTIYGQDSTIICTSIQGVYIQNSGPLTCNITVTQDAGSNSNNYLFSAQTNNLTGNVTWDFGDNTTGLGYNVAHTYANPGIYSVTMTVQANGQTCSSTYAVNVTNSNTSATCEITYNSVNDPSNPNAMIFYTSGNAISSLWQFGDSTTATGNQIYHVFPGPGNYYVCVSNTAADGTTCNNCVLVSVGGNVTNPTCNASFTYSSSDLTAFFVNQSSNSYVNSTTTYNWSFGDGSTSSSPFPYHTYSQAGDYVVCLMVMNGNCFDSICHFVSVSNVVNPIDSCNAYFVIGQQNPFSIDVVNMSNGLSYVWSIAGVSNTSAFPVMTIPFLGSYTLCLTVTNANGCVSTYCDSIVIDSTGIVQRNAETGFTINVVSPAQITGFSVTGINKNSTIESSVFPNPFNEAFTINNPNSEKLQYQLFSSEGKLVLQGSTSNNVERIETENISKGFYMLSVSKLNGERKTIKLNKN